MRVLPKVGDRIRLVAMPDDPNPIDPGQTGTVLSINKVDLGGEAWYQIEVQWNNGRTLMLSCPPDEINIIKN